MRRLFIALLFTTLTAAASAQDLRIDRGNGNWSPLSGGGCIGGSSCSDRRLRLALEDRPVIGVRFFAHDQVGTKAEGVLRVKIDGNTIDGYLDIPRKGEVFTLDVEELRGRYLIFEPVNDDEVEIRDIAVLYGRGSRSGHDDGHGGGPRGGDGPRGGSGRGGWRAYPRAGGCIGGDQCAENGNRITIALERAPVLGIRFFAHDAIGTKADGKLSVRIDDQSIGWTIDVQRAGKRHELDVDGIEGSRLVIQTESDDEVDIKDIEVLYGTRGRGDGPRGSRGEITHEGACIGGSECGGRRARIRIALDGRPVSSIRLYARDDVGARAGGELKIRIDDTILEDSLDIPREGRTFTIDGNGTEGDYLYIEPAEDDEVVVKDIHVRFGED
ncbi:MAG: hypothetical protein ABI779_05855, partial [Acidobacteriota bacterium]